MDFVKRLLIRRPFVSFHTTITNSSLKSRLEKKRFSEKKSFLYNNIWTRIRKKWQQTRFQAFSAAPLSVSVCRHSFTRKNTFLSLNKTRERSGRVNSFSAAAARRLSHYYYSPSPPRFEFEFRKLVSSLPVTFCQTQEWKSSSAMARRASPPPCPSPLKGGNLCSSSGKCKLRIGHATCSTRPLCSCQHW